MEKGTRLDRDVAPPVNTVIDVAPSRIEIAPGDVEAGTTKSSPR
jgi:hypothetical protein